MLITAPEVQGSTQKAHCVGMPNRQRAGGDTEQVVGVRPKCLLLYSAIEKGIDRTIWVLPQGEGNPPPRCVRYCDISSGSRQMVYEAAGHIPPPPLSIPCKTLLYQPPCVLSRWGWHFDNLPKICGINYLFTNPEKYVILLKNKSYVVRVLWNRVKVPASRSL